MSETKKVAAKKSTHVVKEAPDKVAVNAPKTAKGASKHPQKISISPGQRDEMIAETAYYRAAQRSFTDGDPIADWLWAEAEIDKEP